jgi:hypothetical protein
VLDTRTRAHLIARAGAPAAAAGPAPADSLEWLVEAAASIGSALADLGAAVRVVTDAGELTSADARRGLGAGELLDRLAVLQPSRCTDLSLAADLLPRVAGDGPVVALLGAVGAEDVARLTRARSGPGADLAVLLDVGGYAGASGPRTRRSATEAARTTLARQREEAVVLLREAGWRVAVAPAGAPVEDVWAELTRAGVPA